MVALGTKTREVRVRLKVYEWALAAPPTTSTGYMQEVCNLLADGRMYEEVVGEAHKACLLRAPGVYGVVGVGVALAVRVWSLRCLYAAEAECRLPYPLPVKLALPVGYVDAKHHIEQVALCSLIYWALGMLLGPELLGPKDARFHPAKLVLYLRITFDTRVKAFQVSRLLCRFGLALIE